MLYRAFVAFEAQFKQKAPTFDYLKQSIVFGPGARTWQPEWQTLNKATKELRACVGVMRNWLFHNAKPDPPQDVAKVLQAMGKLLHAFTGVRHAAEATDSDLYVPPPSPPWTPEVAWTQQHCEPWLRFTSSDATVPVEVAVHLELSPPHMMIPIPHAVKLVGRTNEVILFVLCAELLTFQTFLIFISINIFDVVLFRCAE